MSNAKNKETVPSRRVKSPQRDTNGGVTFKRVIYDADPKNPEMPLSIELASEGIDAIVVTGIHKGGRIVGRVVKKSNRAGKSMLLSSKGKAVRGRGLLGKRREKIKIAFEDEFEKEVRQQEKKIIAVFGRADATLEKSTIALKEANKQLLALQKIAARAT